MCLLENLKFEKCLIKDLSIINKMLFSLYWYNRRQLLKERNNVNMGCKISLIGPKKNYIFSHENELNPICSSKSSQLSLYCSPLIPSNTLFPRFCKNKYSKELVFTQILNMVSNLFRFNLGSVKTLRNLCWAELKTYI